MSSEICFNVDQSKIVLSGGGLKNKLLFCNSQLLCFQLVLVGEGENALNQHFIFFGTMIPTIIFFVSSRF